MIHSYEYPCSSQSFPSDKTAGISSRTFKVKNISNSLTYTLASSCVCTSPLAVVTVVGLHDFVKVSIPASFKSFLLILCIDAPESTTNSRSSGLMVDGAGRHLFSEGEKKVALFFSFHFSNTFGQPPRCFTGTSLLPSLSLLETDPQKLGHWGCADEDYLGTLLQAMVFGLEC